MTSDLITTAVVRETFSSIVREMRRAMIRSSYSSIIYEGYDFSCAILDADGRLVAQSFEDHPFHVIPVTFSVGKLLESGREVRDDSVFLHNDPYTGGTHLNDVAVIWPVFEAERPLFFVVVRSHWADVGGTTPGSLSGGVTDILQEGLRLDNVRVPKSGACEAMNVVFDNVRAGDEALSDFHAVLGTCRVTEKRLKTLLGKYGTEVVRGAVDDLLDASERRMGAAIRELRDGTYRAVGYLDGNDPDLFPLSVSAALSVRGDRIVVDYRGTSPQVPAPLNAGPAIGPTSVLTIVKSFLDPSGVINSGTFRTISVSAPPGTIICAAYPAPCGGLNEVRFASDAAVMGALAQVIPERMTGDVRGTSNHTCIGGYDAARDRRFIFYEYPSGGTGAFAGSDGNHAVRAFNEGENVSIQSAEIVETAFPLRVLRSEIRPDSGGPGRHRGGCGLIREIEIGCEGAQLSVLSDRNLVPPFGVHRGRAGGANAFRVLRGDRPVDTGAFPGKVAGFPLRPGDVVRIASSGGGGYGASHERDPDLLRDDVVNGYVTESGLAAYGAARGDGERIVRGRPADERTVRVVFAAPGAMARHVCRISGALLRRLGIESGQMVEVAADRGPALRFWVGGFEPGDGCFLVIDSFWREILDGDEHVVRATPTGTPAFHGRHA